MNYFVLQEENWLYVSDSLEIITVSVGGHVDEANDPHFIHLSGTSYDIQSIRNGSSGKGSIKMDVESKQ